jgi:hypothetical protein
MDVPENPFAQIARALREALGPQPYDTEIFLVLITPAIALIIYLLATQRARPRFGGIPDKDLDFFELVRLQKGLEQFDRDLLLDLAENAQIRPVYRLLLDHDVFGQAKKTPRRPAGRPGPASPAAKAQGKTGIPQSPAGAIVPGRVPLNWSDP